MNKKPKICKCGHLRDEHFKQPEKFYSVPNDCNKCKCNDYMRRERPVISDLISLVLGIVILSICVIGMILFIPLTTVTDEVKIPLKVLGIILECILLIVILMCISPLISPYYWQRKRKTYPIEP